MKKPNLIGRAMLFAMITNLVAVTPGSAQSDPELTQWQITKCRIYEQAWGRALDFFGSDNVNYNFIAQSENFIASGCTAGPAVCAQSSQELEIANALTLEMMNAGTASTFLPFKCVESFGLGSTGSAANPKADYELCRAQLELLDRGGKLTSATAIAYENQCACLEQNPGPDAQAVCKQ